MCPPPSSSLLPVGDGRETPVGAVSILLLLLLSPSGSRWAALLSPLSGCAGLRGCSAGEGAGGSRRPQVGSARPPRGSSTSLGRHPNFEARFCPFPRFLRRGDRLWQSLALALCSGWFGGDWGSRGTRHARGGCCVSGGAHLHAPVGEAGLRCHPSAPLPWGALAGMLGAPPAPAQLPCQPRASQMSGVPSLLFSSRGSVSCCLTAPSPRFLWVQVLLPSAWVMLLTVMSEWGPKSGIVCLVAPALPAPLALQSVCLGARGSFWSLWLQRLERGQG